MGRGLDHIADGEGGQVGGAVGHALELEAEGRQPVGDGVEGGVGLEMLLQPGEGELHGLSPPIRLGVSSGTKP